MSDADREQPGRSRPEPLEASPVGFTDSALGPRATRGPLSRTSVAVVTYHSCEALGVCLGTLRRERPAEIFVADNGADAQTAEMVRSSFPEVHYRRFADNPGYGEALNRLLAEASQPFAVLLNADTAVRSGSLRILERHLERHSRAALVGPRLVDEDGSTQPSCYPVPTPFHLFLEESGAWKLARWVPGVRNRYLRTWAHDRVRQVPWVLGAAMAVRKAAFDDVGGFDRDYFLYYEEVDLCLRLDRAGWEIHFTPDAAVTHAGGVSTSHDQVVAKRALFASAAQFYRTYGTRRRRLAFRALVVVLTLARLAQAAVMAMLGRRAQRSFGGTDAARAALLTLVDALRGWDRPIRPVRGEQ